MRQFAGMAAAGVIVLLSNMVRAQEDNAAPTVVYGAAATAVGGENVSIVEQPAGAENPLGNPIAELMTPAEVIGGMQKTASPKPVAPLPSIKEQPAAAGDLPAEAQQLGREFQNTLTEANGMIYDVQAYPEKDVPLMSNPSSPQTIYSPDVNE